jgi:hypothetical protein
MNNILEKNKDVITYGDSVNYDGDECYYIYVNDVNTFKIPKLDKPSEIFNWKDKCNYIPNGQKYIGKASYYYLECCSYDSADNVMEFFEKYNINDADKTIYIIKYQDNIGMEYKNEWIANISITKTKLLNGIAQDERFKGICYYVDILEYEEDGKIPEMDDYKLVEQIRIALTLNDAKQLIRNIINDKQKILEIELEYLEKL